MNTSPDLSKGECRVTFEVGKGMLIEGVRSVCECSDEQIILSTCSRSVIVQGQGLCVCRMLRSSIVICGRINSVSFS
jgi:YabP family.